MKIGIVGAGLIGRAWATVFCGHGFDVTLWDPNPGVGTKAKAFIRKSLKELAELGLVDDPEASLARVSVAKTLDEAVRGAALVQESGPEKLEEKIALFEAMDRLADPSTILASSTSFIVASAFSKKLKGRARCLVAHPVNPPHLVPVVELAPAPWTDPDVVARARRIYEKAKQTPIELRKEAAGFVLNRLQAVLLAEAFRIVGSGVCSPQDLDKTIKDGLGLRWSFMGPFETIELNAPGGIADYCERYGPSLDRMSRDVLLKNPFGRENVDRIMSEWPADQSPERVAKLSKWRDARLAELKAHKSRAPRKPK